MALAIVCTLLPGLPPKSGDTMRTMTGFARVLPCACSMNRRP
jgi:hypothetical protein